MSAQAQANPQTSLYETEIDNQELSDLLDKRAQLKAEMKELSKSYRQADAAAREKIETIELGVDAAVRCGNYVIRLGSVAAREVNFTTDPTTRLFITPLPE